MICLWILPRMLAQKMDSRVFGCLDTITCGETPNAIASEYLVLANIPLLRKRLLRDSLVLQMPLLTGKRQRHLIILYIDTFTRKKYIFTLATHDVAAGQIGSVILYLDIFTTRKSYSLLIQSPLHAVAAGQLVWVSVCFRFVS